MTFYQIFQAVLTCSVTMTVLSLCYLGISRLLRKKQSARWRYAAWWLLGIGFLLPVKPSFGRAPIIVSSAIDDSYSVFPGAGYSGNIPSGITPSHSPFLNHLFLLYVFGVILSAYLVIRRQVRFTRSMKRLRRPADSVTQTVLDLTCIELNITEHIPVYVLPVLTTPMLCGLRTPCILLPDQHYERDALRLIFKHELTHMRHCDLWCKLLWMACRVLHWFNPLLPLLMRRMEQDCELACDETVMRGESDENRAVYCSTILDTALHHVRSRQPVILATNFSGSREMLRARMNDILTSSGKKRFGLLFAGIAVLTVLTGSVFEIWDDANRHSIPIEYPETDSSAAVMTTMSAMTTEYAVLNETPVSVMTTMPPQNQDIAAAISTAPAADDHQLYPSMTTVFVGEDGMVYAVTGYAAAGTETIATTETIAATAILP